MNTEVQALLSKARDSVRAARPLAQQGYTDFAASRASSAMSYAVEARLLSRGRAFSSHSAVIAAFGKEFAKPGVRDPKFHRYLIDGQDLRNAADYDMGTPLTDKQADEVIQWADELIAAAERLLPPGLK